MECLDCAASDQPPDYAVTAQSRPYTYKHQDSRMHENPTIINKLLKEQNIMIQNNFTINLDKILTI